MSSELCGRQKGTDQVSKYEVVGKQLLLKLLGD